VGHLLGQSAWREGTRPDPEDSGEGVMKAGGEP
jgi:hypothetical protein